MDNSTPARVLNTFYIPSVDTVIMTAARPVYQTKEKCTRLEVTFLTLARPAWHLMSYMKALQNKPTKDELESYNLALRDCFVLNLEKVRGTKGFPTKVLCHVNKEDEGFQTMVDKMITETRGGDMMTYYYLATRTK